MNELGDCQIEATISTSGTKGFALSYKVYNDQLNENRIIIGVDGSGHLLSIINQASTTQHNDSASYSSNQELNCFIQILNGVATLKVNNNTFQNESISINPRYLGILNWSTTKTINYTNLKVKKL